MSYSATSTQFLERIKKESPKPVKVRINDNRQTLLSVKWEPSLTKISMHKMFLDAPQNVMDALACYICEGRKPVAPEIKAFIESTISQYDYSHLIDEQKLVQKGAVYDLQEIYDKLNRMYFKDSLSLKITWFGNPHMKNRAKSTLGLYYDSLKLIKVHKRLDDSTVPRFVVEFVVFHEMAHAVCPSYIDEKGMYRSHGSEFKRVEKSFYAYKEAEEWIKKHHMNFFDIGSRNGVQKK